MDEVKVAVKGVLIKNNKMLIVQRSYTDEIGAGTWESTGGGLQFGETFEQALQREFLEEVGLSVKVQQLLYVTTFLTSKTRQIVLLTYLCSSNDERITLSKEHENFMWATKKELKQRLPKQITSDFDEYKVFDLM